MNYRHIYHAGNFADVFKHSILTLLLSYLVRKEKPCVFIDTHAGIGAYDLRDERARKTKEADSGIFHLIKQPSTPSALKPYLELVLPFLNATNASYPGSPEFMRAFQREGDHVILNELHPADFASLKQHVKKAQRTHLHQQDAYTLLPAILPPTPRRGLILIDPPFEKKDELQRFDTALKKALHRFATGVYMLWYPIVDIADEKQVQKLINSLELPSINAVLKIDQIYRTNRGMSGCGVLIINPPWQIQKQIDEIGQYLCRIFARNEAASYSSS